MKGNKTMEDDKSISIYDLNDKIRYSFVAEVHDPLSHEKNARKHYVCIATS